ISRIELLYQQKFLPLAEQIARDIKAIKPQSDVNLQRLDFRDPRDFEQVYTVLFNFAGFYDFDLETEDYLIHITTGTHVAQICLFLLTESRRLPGCLVQTSPPENRKANRPGFKITDLDLSKYDLIASRFRQELSEATAFLKDG